MIIRVVQMNFRAEEIETFQALFAERKERIQSFEGCLHLELWQDVNRTGIFFTYSHWESEQHLNHYRFSEFFKETWKATKVLFAEKAQAWSVERKG
ncbi:MAG: antibiotic biosynthesis monooxygenase family protein [Chitinophagaceae bacterium]